MQLICDNGVDGGNLEIWFLYDLLWHDLPTSVC